MMGADPHGMSGGPLFLAAEVRGDGGSTPVFYLAGILIHYHKAPKNTFVAVRIESLLDALAPQRPVVERLFRSDVAP